MISEGIVAPLVAIIIISGGIITSYLVSKQPNNRGVE